MIPEGSLQANVQGELAVLLVDIDPFHQHPQMGFRQLALFQNVVHHTDVPLQPGLPAAEGDLDILELLDLLLRRRDLLLPLLDHAVIAFRVCLVPDAFHQDHLHLVLQHFHPLGQLFDPRGGGGGLGPPLVDQMLHGVPVVLIHPLGLEQFFADQAIQRFLLHRVGGAVFLAVAVVGVASVLHPLPIFQLDPLSHKGAAAVLAAEQAAVSENSLARRRPCMVFFPRLEKYLRLLPNFLGHNDGEIVLMPELL